MFIVQIKPPVEKPNEVFYLDARGKKTAYLSKAKLFSDSGPANDSGDEFISKAPRGYSFSVERG